MFDEDDYYSDEDDNVMFNSKNMASSKVLAPSSEPQFNNMAGEGESLLKMMKDRGCMPSLTQSTSPTTSSRR